MDGGMCPVSIGGEIFYKPLSDEFVRVGHDHIGEALAVSVYLRGRSIVEHNRYRAILRHAVQNLQKPDGSAQYDITSKKAEERAIEHLHFVLRLKAGFTRTVQDFEGIEHTVPESTDFQTPEDRVQAYRAIAYEILAGALGCKVRDLFEIGLIG